MQHIIAALQTPDVARVPIGMDNPNPSCVRLYQRPRSPFCLQIRGRMLGPRARWVAAYAHADLDRTGLIALRDAINRQLLLDEVIPAEVAHG